MSKYTLVVTDTGNNIGDLSVESLSLGVLQGSGPKGAGWTGVTYDTNTGKFTFTSNDGLGYTSDDITVGLDAAVAAAQAAQAATEALFDQFGDQYLGPKASDPTTDNDGDPLTQGDIYWNTTDSVLKFYSGAAWVAPEAIATNAAAAALASETAAATSETNAATSASNAATSATNAATSATAAAGSESAAASSASAAATSESNAAASASAASTSETNSATSATNAANSATAAATSATNSANSATAAASSASAAATSATNAANSAAASATSASASSTSATNSANSASAAATSATNAATSESNAASSATSAASSATAAAASASAAATSEANIDTAIVDTVTKTFVDNLNVDADTLDGQHGSYYTGYTDTAIANLIDTAPTTLDTLNELAAALGDDPNFATTVTNNIATKVSKSGDTMTGNLIVPNLITAGLVDGRDVSVDGAKLDGIEAGATGDQTAGEILTLLKTVDGSGSGLDADTLDGINSSQFLRSDEPDFIYDPSGLRFSQSTTSNYSPVADAVSNAPFGAREWHDLFAFNRNYTTTYETFDGSSWSSATLDKRVFAQKENQTVTLATGTGVTKVRWNWTGTSWGSGAWLVIGFTYTPSAANKTVTLESSADNVNWTQRHQSTTSASADVIYFPVASYGGDNYLRLTIDRNDTNDLKVSFISLLSSRSGDQGKGKEQELPFAWDENKNITFEADVTTTGNVIFSDNDKAIFGAGSDLQIYHDGSNSWIRDGGTGDLVITTNGAGIQFKSNGSSEQMLRLFQDGPVQLYYDNNLKLATTSTGVDVTGSLNVTDAATTRTNIDVDQAGTALALAIALG